MYGVWHRDNPGKPLRNRRTKDGCLTCKRRRVRCNLERPRCGHCSRLQLDCSWSGPPSTPAAANATAEHDAYSSRGAASQPTPRASSSAEPVTPRHPQSLQDTFLGEAQKEQQEKQPSPHHQQQQHQEQPQAEASILATPTSELAAVSAPDRNHNPSLEKTFDFASFLWDPTTFNNALPDMPLNQWTPTTNSFPHPPDLNRYSANQLLEHFKLSDAPPILAPMETRTSWYSMRDQILSMVSVSPMVYFAVLAFSALQIRNDKSSSGSSTFSSYYIRSQEHITTSTLEIQADPGAVSSRSRHVLAALFFLSYVDLVTDRMSSAHVNLRMAYDIVTSLDKENLTSAEVRLISWFRLLDGRAVSAGGEGLFLKEDGDAYDSSRGHSPPENDAEATISEMLSKPSLRLFQKTQSYMGRISQIDQWHRERGTVEDETEVMAIASDIRRDYRRLYQQMHPVLEQAISGSLNPPLLSASLAASVARKCRIAMANYYAIPIHLHRVAYRHLPRSADVQNAINVLRQLTHEMRDALADDEALPVNMLWPLLMWGSEEDSAEQRAWIIQAIRQMENSVSNAGITADVLEELWRRQDGSGQRGDIRTVMHETFNSCFAIV
ncbi:hypothetical protein NLU13_5528 [Sarocladium strictum]|uniref:Zn(2)-C6 fungal-type domain-containing protein n=1 Tax=Sarocladium strictum TaxID=5046 RepID=A0AA39L7W3_SARSR|nr:hypothetical protein NLU13_5528 [Sarocladium strictum]